MSNSEKNLVAIADTLAFKAQEDFSLLCITSMKYFKIRGINDEESIRFINIVLENLDYISTTNLEKLYQELPGEFTLIQKAKYNNDETAAAWLNFLNSLNTVLEERHKEATLFKYKKRG